MPWPRLKVLQGTFDLSRPAAGFSCGDGSNGRGNSSGGGGGGGVVVVVVVIIQQDMAFLWVTLGALLQADCLQRTTAYC